MTYRKRAHRLMLGAVCGLLAGPVVALTLYQRDGAGNVNQQNIGVDEEVSRKDSTTDRLSEKRDPEAVIRYRGLLFDISGQLLNLEKLAPAGDNQQDENFSDFSVQPVKRGHLRQ